MPKNFDITAPLQIVANYWTYKTEDLQEAFFRDWGTFWNDVGEPCDEAIAVLNQIPSS